MIENLLPRKLETELKFACLLLLLIDLMPAFGSHVINIPHFHLPALLEDLQHILLHLLS